MTPPSKTRRRICLGMLLPMLGALPRTLLASTVVSARVWPAQEYSRLILESGSSLGHHMYEIPNPDRLVIDLDDVELAGDLADLPRLVHPGDPYIQSIRVARYKPGTVRIVIDLKTDVSPQLFALQPYGDHGHRVVLDLYPLTPTDPLMALLEFDRGGRSEEGRPQPPAVDSRPPPLLKGGRRPIIIAIDPGHGGEDPGAIGRRGTCEKNVTLAIGRRLKALIDAEPGMRAMLTRDDDYYVALHARVQKARRVQADLFVSVHADAFSTPTARGSSVFALSEHGATSAAARWLAQRENEADLIGGVNIDVRDRMLAHTLLDLSQTAQINDSLRVGRSVLENIGAVNTLHKGSVEQAGFAVLKAPDIPSILVETAFISNPEEEQKLRSEAQQQRFAESILGGIKRYFAQNPPLARARSG